METASSVEELIVLPTTAELVEVKVLNYDGLGMAKFEYDEKDHDIVVEYQLREKLMDAYACLDIRLYGFKREGRYLATSVVEGCPGEVASLPQAEFELFCEALDIPYECHL